METVQMHFRARGGDRGARLDAIETYLGALYKNGQAIGDCPIAEVKDGYLVTLQVPRADTLDSRWARRWVRNTEAGLKSVGLTRTVKVLGRDPDSLVACQCRRRKSLILFANMLTDESPVRCGDCFGPVPLYTLPRIGSSGDYADLLGWQKTYQAMDTLHIGSGVGAGFAHRQMSDVRSDLSVEGRELAALLEEKVRRPVYYYLMKHYGASDSRERRRRCPSCSGSWTLGEPLHRIFDFRCENCRLLSNVAFEVRTS